MADRSNPVALAAREARKKEIAELEVQEAALEARRVSANADRIEATKRSREVCAELDSVRKRLAGMRRSLGQAHLLEAGSGPAA